MIHGEAAFGFLKVTPTLFLPDNRIFLYFWKVYPIKGGKGGFGSFGYIMPKFNLEKFADSNEITVRIWNYCS